MGMRAVMFSIVKPQPISFACFRFDPSQAVYNETHLLASFQLRMVNYSVPQNSSGDAAFQKALEVAQQILPNGPVAVKMAKAAINRGMQVRQHRPGNVFLSSQICRLGHHGMAWIVLLSSILVKIGFLNLKITWPFKN